MLSIVSAAASAFAPPATDGAAFARSMVSTITWGTLSTSSTRSEGTNVGTAFGNPYSIADVGGVPYVYASGLDASATDLFGKESSSPLCTLTLSQATVQHANGSAVFSACGESKWVKRSGLISIAPSPPTPTRCKMTVMFSTQQP